MKDTVFNYLEYKPYVNNRLDDAVHSGGRGARTRLAEATRCQTPYVAQVLRGSAHFSLEQAEAINGFFGHSEAEGDFFLLLLQYCRSTSPPLRARLKRQLQNLKAQNLNLKNRFASHAEITEPDQAIYYSSWIYGAIHAIVSVPGFQSVESIAKGLNLAPTLVGDSVAFLLACGILEKKKGRLSIGKWRLHLNHDSPWIAQHHLNWRLRAMQSIEKTQGRGGLHYSSVVSVSQADAEKIHELLIQSLQAVREIVRESPEEKLRSFCMDWFEP